MPKKSEAEIVLEVFNECKSIKKTSMKLGISRNIVMRHVHNAGVPRLRSGHAPLIDGAKIIELYMQGHSTTAIAELMGIGKTTAGDHIKAAGVSRSKSESVKNCFAVNRKSHSMEKHPSWKGGRFTASQSGYVFVLVPGHPRANPKRPYVQEHIIEWEKAHGRFLPEGWVVHHINAIRNDNRPENLLGLYNRDHHGKMLQQELQKKIQELENEVRELKSQLSQK